MDMIHFFVGTKAQFIKMAPIMVELQDRGIGFRYIDSGQHAELTKKLRRTFGIRKPDVCLYAGKDVASIPGALIWCGKLGLSSLVGRRRLEGRVFVGGGVCVIHGDTLSTLLGLKMARIAGLKVAHVEAGLRSFSIWHPFPEELIRVYCMKRCDLLFAPSQQAQDNLKAMNVRGRVVGVKGNTVVDALRLMDKVPATISVPKEAFALATCHRLETIARRRRLERVVALLNRVSREMKVVFVTHKPTRKYLERFGLKDELSGSISVLDMQDYVDFVAFLRSARIVLTDGGSIQEGCAYLNKPCLILRQATERPDGLGNNAMLWGFDDSIAGDFLGKAWPVAPVSMDYWPRPSVQIVDALIKMEVLEGSFKS